MSLRIDPGETIVTAYAQKALGAGWSNDVVWVVVRDAQGGLREECIQPEEQTEALRLLVRVTDEGHRMLVGMVKLIARGINPIGGDRIGA